MIASAHVAKLLKHTNVITTDMGGTSFDVGLITDGYWRYAPEPIVERFRTLQPIIDIESIGAGGGTVARVDPDTGRLLVGPKSAGASPGPVCYGSGGQEVTVTDADLVLGIIDPNYFLGGRKTLNKDKTLKAIDENIARPLKLKVHEAAAGVYDIVNSKMADLIRRQVVRTGYLPEEFVIYAFGGGGLVHAAGFAADLGIKKIYIFSTFPGLLRLRRRVGRCHSYPADDLSEYILPAEPAVINQRLDSIESEMKQIMGEEGFKPGEVDFRRFFTMRYRRQTAGVELPVTWNRFSTARIDELRQIFEKKYEELYGVGAGYTKAGIEISAIRVDAVGRVAKPRLGGSQKEEGSSGERKKRQKKDSLHPSREKTNRYPGL